MQPPSYRLSFLTIFPLFEAETQKMDLSKEKLFIQTHRPAALRKVHLCRSPTSHHPTNFSNLFVMIGSPSPGLPHIRCQNSHTKSHQATMVQGFSR
jgi:hypothetical protein